MTAVKATCLVTLVIALSSLTVVASQIRDAMTGRPPLVKPVYCEGTPDTGFCYLDLSDGREYVIYTGDTGKLDWYEQDWRAR